MGIAESVHKKLGREQDRPDAVHGKTIFPANFLATECLVAGEEIAAKCMPFIEDHRETPIDLAQPAANT